MVKAWYMDCGTDASVSNQRELHQGENPQFIELEDLAKKTLIKYWKLDADNYEEEGKLKQIREENGYSYEDSVHVTKSQKGYEEMIQKFFIEHIHADDETRFVTDGSGYFDARDPANDRWIRVEVVKGDMISLPAGIYHRFTLDTKDYIKANRYFTGMPVWTPFNRPQDDHPSRKGYLEKMGL